MQMTDSVQLIIWIIDGYLPPLDLVRNGGAYGFGLDFRVHACVCNHISDMYGPISFVLGTKTKHDGLHKHIIFVHDAVKEGRLAAILIVENPHVEHVLNHLSDMHLPILFKFGTQIMNDGLHKHVIFILFRDQFQDGRLAAILLLKHVPNHFSDMHDLILFKLGTSTVHDGIHWLLTLFCNLIKRCQPLQL